MRRKWLMANLGFLVLVVGCGRSSLLEEYIWVGHDTHPHEPTRTYYFTRTQLEFRGNRAYLTRTCWNSAETLKVNADAEARVTLVNEADERTEGTLSFTNSSEQSKSFQDALRDIQCTATMKKESVPFTIKGKQSGSHFVLGEEGKGVWSVYIARDPNRSVSEYGPYWNKFTERWETEPSPAP